MFQLLADSGSTKTDWAFIAPHTQPQRFKTSGMNPCLMDDDVLVDLLQTEVLPQLQQLIKAFHEKNSGNSILLFIDELRFYGAGCRPEQVERMRHLLATQLHVNRVEVASDLLGAAHALCGSSEGIVCILGTGSGSALYNGERFVQSTPSLGYILGDEGSGASLGKHLLADVLKQQLPKHLCQAFLSAYQIDVATAIQRIYREPAPNRYMASFTHFLSEYRAEEAIQSFLKREFRQFFYRNIRPYHRPDLKVNFVGSIAAVFKDELMAAAKTEGFEIGKVIVSPIDAFL